VQQTGICDASQKAKELSQNQAKLSQTGVKTVTTDPKRVDYKGKQGSL